MLRKWGELVAAYYTGKARIHRHYSASLILLLMLTVGMIGILIFLQACILMDH